MSRKKNDVDQKTTMDVSLCFEFSDEKKSRNLIYILKSMGIPERKGIGFNSFGFDSDYLEEEDRIAYYALINCFVELVPPTNYLGLSQASECMDDLTNEMIDSDVKLLIFDYLYGFSLKEDDTLKIASRGSELWFNKFRHETPERFDLMAKKCSPEQWQSLKVTGEKVLYHSLASDIQEAANGLGDLKDFEEDYCKMKKELQGSKNKI